MRNCEFLIIGAGFGGVTAAVELARAGRRDVLLVERAASIGGVWRDNTYPGAGCDVPSPYYSLSFEPKPDWPRRYSQQPDILGYLDDVARTYDLPRRTICGAAAVEARFDDDACRWHVTLDDGRSITARFLIPAVGQLSNPALPVIDGVGTFDGPEFHSARWRHDVHLRGKRVGVIGTGASAVQFIPHLQQHAAHLTVFQRSAPYLLPRMDHVYTDRQHRMFRAVPGLLALERLFWWCFAELWTLQMKQNRLVDGIFRAWSALHRRRQVRGRALRASLTPDYTMGCKRALFSSDYYPAVARDNVAIETVPVSRITPHGVRTADGTEHRLDVLIYGTGFRTQDFLAGIDVRGRGGSRLADHWSDGARAYLGMSVPGFPNMFLMYGPNTNLGSGSVLFMLEQQARYIRRIADAADSAGTDAVDVRADREDEYDAAVQNALQRTAWSKCVSWYTSRSGRISSNWPDTVSSYRRRLAYATMDDYQPSL